MAGHRHRLLSKMLIIVLSGWSLCSVLPEFARVFTDYATLGFEANNDGVVKSVRGPPASEAGIRRNDCIDLQHTPLPDLLAVFAGMGGMAYVRPDTAVTLNVTPAPCRGANLSSSPRVLKAQAIGLTPAARLMLVLTGALGVFSIALGAVLVWQKPSVMTWGFFLYVIWFNPGLNFVFYAELQRYPYAVLLQEFFQAAAQAAGYAGFIAFALRFPRNVVAPQWRRVEVLLPAVIVVFFLLNLAIFGTALGFRTEGVSRWSYGLGYVVPAAVLLILRFRQKEQMPTDRQRTLWVHWACRIGLFAFIFADSNMSTSLWDPLVAPFCAGKSGVAALVCDNGRLSETTLLAFLALNATIPLSVFYAVKHYRVIDIRFALGRGSTLVLTSVLIALALAYASIKIEDHLESSLGSRVLVYVLLVMLVKITFERLHETLNHACDNVFFRHLHAAEHSVGRVANELMHKPDSFDAIDRRLIQVPVQSLGLTSGAVFRLQPTGIYRQGIDPVGLVEGRDAAFPLGTAEVKVLKQRGEAMRLDELVPAKQEEQHTAEPVIALPIIAAEELVAVALYSAHRSGYDITTDEQKILEGLIEPAGNAYGWLEMTALRRRLHELSQRLKEPSYDPGGG
jgi:hypothetical protein